jgi:hypothetical protein
VNTLVTGRGRFDDSVLLCQRRLTVVVCARGIFALWCSLLLCVGAGGGAGLIEAEQQSCDGRGRQCAGMEL